MTVQVCVCPRCKALCTTSEWNAKKNACHACTRNKYHAETVVVDGEMYHSRKEANRHQQHQRRALAGEITDLKRQVPYKLLVNGEHVCTYIADHQWTENGVLHVEDTKSSVTRKLAPYRIKVKLMHACYGIIVKEF